MGYILKANKYLIFLAATILNSSYILADEIKIGFVGLSMDYVERDVDESFLDSEKSSLFDILGIDAHYKGTFNGLDHNYSTNLYVMLSYVQGKSNYDGALQDLETGTTTPYKSKSGNDLVNFKLRAEEVRHTGNLDVKIFVGAGYRFWNRNLDEGGIYGFSEEYKWLYGDAGVGCDFFEGNSTLGFSSSLQYAYKPTMQLNFGSGCNFNLGQTWGYNAEIHFRENLPKSFFIEVGYEYDYWKISRSNIVADWIEPDSKTNNQYIKLSIGMNF